MGMTRPNPVPRAFIIINRKESVGIDYGFVASAWIGTWLSLIPVTAAIAALLNAAHKICLKVSEPRSNAAGAKRLGAWGAAMSLITGNASPKIQQVMLAVVIWALIGSLLLIGGALMH